MYKRFCAHLIIVCLIIAIFSCIPQPAPELICTSVIDGDTIKLSDETTVRYLGIDTHEVDEPLGPEATEANRALVEGKKVRLEYDVQKQDKYGRTLAYVYLEDGTFVNAELVGMGYAQVSTYPPNVKYVDTFREYQREALTAKRGMWAGGTLYPIGGRDPVYCPKCLEEMSYRNDDTWICRHCAEVFKR